MELHGLSADERITKSGYSNVCILAGFSFNALRDWYFLKNKPKTENSLKTIFDFRFQYNHI